MGLPICERFPTVSEKHAMLLLPDRDNPQFPGGAAVGGPGAPRRWRCRALCAAQKQATVDFLCEEPEMASMSPRLLLLALKVRSWHWKLPVFYFSAILLKRKSYSLFCPTDFQAAPRKGLCVIWCSTRSLHLLGALSTSRV